MFAAIVGQSWATVAHPYNLEINGSDWIDAVISNTLHIEMAGPSSNGSLSVRLYDPAVGIDVAPWDEVTFTEHAATRPVLFGGFVQSVRYTTEPGLTGRWVDVECVGYGILLDKRIVVRWPGAW